MRTLMALLLVGVLIIGVSTSAFAQDEPPNLLGVRALLSNGNAVTADLDAEVGMHLYAFEGERDAQIAINMSRTDGEIDPFLILLRADGRVEAWDDDGGNDLDARLQWTLPEDGVYFALAANWRGLYQNYDDDELDGTYRIEISGASAASGDLKLDPQSLPIQKAELDSTIQGALNNDQPIFFAWLTVRDSIVVDLAAPSNQADTLMYVFDVEGQRIAVDDDGGPDGLSAFVPGLPLTEPGQYLIMVTSYGFYEVNERGTQGGPFNLVVSRGS